MVRTGDCHAVFMTALALREQNWPDPTNWVLKNATSFFQRKLFLPRTYGYPTTVDYQTCYLPLSTVCIRVARITDFSWLERTMEIFARDAAHCTSTVLLASLDWHCISRERTGITNAW